MPGPHPAPLEPPRATQAADRFRALHEGFFVMANPWDVGSAKLLKAAGFVALATSSAAHAWSLGKPDGTLTRREAVDHAAAVGNATGLPVNGDFEDGYGDTPAEVADTVAAALQAGVAGCSIEDLSRGPEPLIEERMACRRLEAARETAERDGSAFVITGRCEAILAGVPDALTVVVSRLAAYRRAGAHVLYAPGLRTEADVSAVLSAADGIPVNVIAGFGGISDDLAALERLGVRRVSLGSNLAKVALGAFCRSAEALANGRLALSERAGSDQINGAMS